MFGHLSGKSQKFREIYFTQRNTELLQTSIALLAHSWFVKLGSEERFDFVIQA